MATIWKRKDRKIWVVDYRDRTGKLVRVVGGSARAEAEAMLADKIKASKNAVEPSHDESITLEAFAERWLMTVKSDSGPAHLPELWTSSARTHLADHGDTQS